MTPQNIAALQALVQANPALAQQLQNATTTDSAVQLLAQSASQQGIAVDAADLAEHIHAVQARQMSDADLQIVAGGNKALNDVASWSLFAAGINYAEGALNRCG